MMFLYMKNGDCIEIEAAASAEKRKGLLVFLDRSGQTIQAFESRSAAISAAVGGHGMASEEGYKPPSGASSEARGGRRSLTSHCDAASGPSGVARGAR